MPNRIIKESVTTSDTINLLTDAEEAFFLRLTTVCDDYGRFDARAEILLGRLYPLRTHLLTPAIICERLQALESAGILFTYHADGRDYIQITKWAKHQSIRAKSSKYPDPPRKPAYSCKQMLADASKRKQMQADESDCSLERERERERERKRESGTGSGTGSETGSETENDKTEPGVTHEDLSGNSQVDIPPPIPAILTRDERFNLTRDLAEYSQREFGKPLFSPANVQVRICESFEEKLTELEVLAAAVLNRMVLAPISDRCLQDYWKNQFAAKTSPFTSSIFAKLISQAINDLAERNAKLNKAAAPAPRINPLAETVDNRGNRVAAVDRKSVV